MRSAIRGLLFGDTSAGPVASELLLLLARVFTGLALALAHGLGKFPPPARFVGAVTGLGFPAAFAWLSAGTELVGGVMLAAGLLTRPAALAIAVNMAVAAFLAHAADPFRTREPALLFLALAAVFLARGGGPFSLDRLVGRRP